MLRRTFLVTSAVITAGCGPRSRQSPVAGTQRGIGFDGFRATVTPDDFANLKRMGATHLALFAFGYMRRFDEPVVFRYDGPRTDWSLTDEGLVATGTMAREAGLKVILLPTLADFVDGHWRGETEMKDDSWDAWFESYRRFLLHYAQLAEKMRAVGFSVGTELRKTVAHETPWRQIIALVRERFRGWLTYAANWDDYDTVPWWDAVDLIGVQAYFELGTGGDGSTADRTRSLVESWTPIKQRLSTLSAQTTKRILFTEIGYKSHTAATAYPWKWEIEGVADPTIQAAAYDAAFRAFWSEPWFAGFYWWKWRPAGANDDDADRDFTPQGKPAENVLRRYYSASI